MSRTVPGRLGGKGWYSHAIFTLLAVSMAGPMGCASATANVTGTANGIAFGETAPVSWGARFVIISAVELECSELAWVEQNYDTTGGAPTEFDTSLLQFTFAGELIETGTFSIAQGAQVQATVVNIDAGAFHESNATAGTLDLESVEDEGFAEGWGQIATPLK